MNTQTIIITRLPRKVACKDSSQDVDIKATLTQARKIISEAGWNTQEELAHQVKVLEKLSILINAIK